MTTAVARAADPLEALLFRCHREELLPLAKMLGVEPKDLGLGDLARALARAFRIQSTNLFISKATGDGEPYVTIVTRILQKRRVTTPTWPPDPEELELLALRTFFAERWERLTPEERARLWTELGIDGSAPTAGTDATSKAGEALGPRFAYELSHQFNKRLARPSVPLAAAGCLFPALFAPLLLYSAAQPHEPTVIDALSEIVRLRQAVRHRVTVGVVGSPSTGKDAAIKALFGIDSGNISPIAGSTKEVAISRLPKATALYVVNTPGMGDVVERVTEEARQVLDHIDVYLYLINAEGGVQQREKTDYERCVATGKPVLVVVNKVDVLRPNDKEKFLADCRKKLGCDERDFAAVAFDPLPQLSETPIGRERVREWLVERLVERGKDPSEIPPLP